jgi:Flp pilus assembly protein TadG
MLADFMRALFGSIGRFKRDQRGNIAAMFAIVCVPLISAVGCAVDYSVANRIKAKLQSAADAASVASISQKSPGFIAGAAMTSDGPIAVGVTDANNVFDGNVAAASGFTNLSRTSTVTKTGIKTTSKVQFTADVPVVFMKLIGQQKITVSGSSSATASLPPYLDFYLTLDVSGSMGLPSTNDGQTHLAAVNPDQFGAYPGGCTLACHFSPQNVCSDTGSSQQKYPTNNYCMGYAITRVSYTGYQNILAKNGGKLPSSMLSGLPNSLNTDSKWGLAPVSSCPTPGTDACIQLRADAVGFAVNKLFETANASTKVAGQFRIGLYPFIQDLYAYFPLTSAINGSATATSTINFAAANLASQLDTNTNANLGSGGTHIDTSLTTLNGLIKSVGDGGSSSKSQPFVFLVTDGAQDPQTKALNQSGGWSGSNHATVIDPTKQCQTIKNRGIIISVLYIPYQPIQNPNPSFANDEDDAANNNIKNIQGSLQGCASPGFFYTANTPDDITAALNVMFFQALATAHITN